MLSDSERKILAQMGIEFEDILFNACNNLLWQFSEVDPKMGDIPSLRESQRRRSPIFSSRDEAFPKAEPASFSLEASHQIMGLIFSFMQCLQKTHKEDSIIRAIHSLNPEIEESILKSMLGEKDYVVLHYVILSSKACHTVLEHAPVRDQKLKNILDDLKDSGKPPSPQSTEDILSKLKNRSRGIKPEMPKNPYQIFYQLILEADALEKDHNIMKLLSR